MFKVNRVARGPLLAAPFGLTLIVVSLLLCPGRVLAAKSSRLLPPIRMAPKVEREENVPGTLVSRAPAAEEAPSATSPMPSASPPPPAAAAAAAPPSRAAAPAPPSLLSITRVVGEVSDAASTSIITSREVQINDVIEQAVFGKLPGQTQLRLLRGNEKSFPNDVQTVLREWVIYLEAKSFASDQVSKSDLASAMKTVETVTAGFHGWQTLEPSNQEVTEIVERKLIAKKFLRLKLDSAQVPISDAEALAYFKKNRLKFGNLPFESFRDNIKTFLIKQDMDRRLREWVEVLERRYKVRNFIAG